jgi:hypothetical protein
MILVGEKCVAPVGNKLPDRGFFGNQLSRYIWVYSVFLKMGVQHPSYLTLNL